MYCVTAGRIVSFPTLTSSPRQYKYYTCFVKKHQHNLLIFHSFIPFFNVIVLMFLYLLYKLYNFDSFFPKSFKNDLLYRNMVDLHFAAGRYDQSHICRAFFAFQLPVVVDIADHDRLFIGLFGFAVPMIGNVDWFRKSETELPGTDRGRCVIGYGSIELYELFFIFRPVIRLIDLERDFFCLLCFFLCVFCLFFFGPGFVCLLFVLCQKPLSGC